MGASFIVWPSASEIVEESRVKSAAATAPQGGLSFPTFTWPALRQRGSSEKLMR